MTNIRDLTMASVVSAADQIPVNDVTTNRTRAITVQQLSEFIEAGLPAANTQNFVPATGGSIKLNDGTNILFLDPAGTLATFSITFPVGSVDGQTLTILSTQTITALTLAAGTGQTLRATTTTIAANTAVRYVFSLNNQAWYKA